MNIFESKGEAVVKYLSGDLRVVKPGSYIVCAISGAHVSLDSLQYWDADKQEGYASFEEAAKAVGLTLYSSEKS